MISSELEVSLNLAVSEAARRGHEYVTIEHVLYALLFNEAAAKALRASGGNTDATRAMLEDYFKENYPEELLKPGQMPQPTLAFQRVIQRAAQHVRASGKEKIRGDNLLVSLFSERESFAVYFLKKQNVTRFDILNFISHGIVKAGVEQTFGDDTGQKSLPPNESEEGDAGDTGEEEDETGERKTSKRSDKAALPRSTSAEASCVLPERRGPTTAMHDIVLTAAASRCAFCPVR